MFVCTTGGSGRRQLGGAERFLVEMIPALAATGVDVVACTPDDDVAVALRAAGVPWTEAGATGRVDLNYLGRIRHLVREVKPDVVSAHLLSAAMHSRAALSVERQRTPLLVALHNSLWQYRDAAATAKQKAAVQLNISLDLAMRRVRPHVTVAVSEFEAEELRLRGRVSNVRVIPNPLPSSWPATCPPVAADRHGPVRVGYLGRLEREKGADLLGGIAELLPDAILRIAGTGSVVVPRLPNVELLGRVDAGEFLAGVDCLVVPSRVESFGRSALEAMSIGVPVVHSGVGGLAEITRGAQGVLAFAAALEPASMAAAIRTATGDAGSPRQRAALANRYLEDFAFAHCVRRWSSLYKELADDDH